MNELFKTLSNDCDDYWKRKEGWERGREGGKEGCKGVDLIYSSSNNQPVLVVLFPPSPLHPFTLPDKERIFQHQVNFYLAIYFSCAAI